jgi:dethiobiotin synthetase
MAHLACALCAPLVLVVELRPGRLNHALLTCNADPSADGDALHSAAAQLLARAAWVPTISCQPVISVSATAGTG